MATQLTYALIKDCEWGDTVWLLVAPNSSPFGRYYTQAEAKRDAKIWQLKVERRTDLDSPSAGQKGY